MICGGFSLTRAGVWLGGIDRPFGVAISQARQWRAHRLRRLGGPPGPDMIGSCGVSKHLWSFSWMAGGAPNCACGHDGCRERGAPAINRSTIELVALALPCGRCVGAPVASSRGCRFGHLRLFLLSVFSADVGQ